MSENKMARLVVVKNPFQPWNGRIIKEIAPGTKLRKELIGDANIGCDIYTSVNGKTVLIDDYEVLGGEVITVSPVVGKGGGGKILGLVAMVALAVVSMGVGNVLAVGAGGAGSFFGGIGATSVWGWASYAAAAAVMFVGGTLINKAFFSMPTATALTNSESESTYGWSGVQTLEGQNNPIAMTYGKVKSAGQSIAKYVQVVDNKEYLNWLLACGEGELEFYNILINDNPVEYYEGMELETRSGSNDQEIIPYFNDTYFTKSLGYEIRDNAYRTDTAQGNGTQGLIAKIEFSQGLYYAKNDGNLGEAWVDIAIEYKEKNSDKWLSLLGEEIREKRLVGAPSFLTLKSQDVLEGDYTLIVRTTPTEKLSVKSAKLITPDGEEHISIFNFGFSFLVNKFDININKAEEGTYNFSVDTVVTDKVGTVRIKGSQSSALRKEYRADNLPAGEYEVRVMVTDRSHKTTDSRAGVKCYWSAITSIVYDDFIYPNIALIGVRALATDQISGSPSISFLKERKYVWVYNPNTEEYEQRPANNPAWACYDMLHLANRLYNINTEQYEIEVRGVPAHSMLYEQFNEWAQFCEEKSYYVNIEICATGEMLNTINENIACIGHGIVLRFGTKYGCVWYCKKQPVQMFGMGNIVAGTFKEDFLETTSRANSVEITYMDADHDYNKETITIFSDSYDEEVENATQVTYNGITSYEQAFREGKYQLYSNKYQLRTVSFEANIDAITCTIGDVVLVAHDVPRWTHSGRIYDVDIDNGLFRLPVELDAMAGNIRLMYRTVNDKLYTIGVVVIENANGWCTVQGKITNLEDLPQKGDIFDIGLADVGSKPFVVTNITRAQDFTRNITGIEYIESVYDENYEIPPINYSESVKNVAQDVTGLNGNRVTYVTSDGIRTTRLFVSWNMAENGGRYTLLYSDDNQETWHIIQSNMGDCSWQGDINALDDIYIKVITTLGVSKSLGAIYGPIVAGIDELPPDVKHLDTEVLEDKTRRYYWDFEYPVPNDIAGFKMKYLQGTDANWDMGYDVQDGLITVQPYETTTVRQGAHVVMIKAIDNAGNESENFASCVVDFGDPKQDNVLYQKMFSANGWSECETNGEITEDGYIRSKQSSYHFGDKQNLYWKKPADYYWNESYIEFYLQAEFKALASGFFYIIYDIEGVSNLTYKNNNTDNLFKPYSTKVYVNAGDIITIRFESQAGPTRTILKSLKAIIDVPDRVEHFENIAISKDGTELPIKTSNYKTTAVVIDAISTSVAGSYELVKVSEEPCVVKFEVVENDASLTRRAIDVIADITWQGFENETL